MPLAWIMPTQECGPLSATTQSTCALYVLKFFTTSTGAPATGEPPSVLLNDRLASVTPAGHVVGQMKLALVGVRIDALSLPVEYSSANHQSLSVLRPALYAIA